MSMTVSEADPTQAIALYIDLEPDQKADLENIARASIAFVQALRAAAHEIDPDLDIRVELIDST